MTQHKLELHLAESSGELTHTISNFDELSDENVLIQMLKFYIKLGFSHLPVTFKSNDIELIYSPIDNTIKIYATGKTPYILECELWDSE